MIWDTEVKTFPPRTGTGGAKRLGNRRPARSQGVRRPGTAGREATRARRTIRLPTAAALATAQTAVTPGQAQQGYGPDGGYARPRPARLRPRRQLRRPGPARLRPRQRTHRAGPAGLRARQRIRRPRPAGLRPRRQLRRPRPAGLRAAGQPVRGLLRAAALRAVQRLRARPRAERRRRLRRPAGIPAARRLRLRPRPKPFPWLRPGRLRPGGLRPAVPRLEMPLAAVTRTRVVATARLPRPPAAAGTRHHAGAPAGTRRCPAARAATRRKTRATTGTAGSPPPRTGRVSRTRALTGSTAG